MTSDIAEARRAEYVGFLYRHPFVTDAYELGFLPGAREDYTLQTGSFANVDVPMLMVDNDFRDANLGRFVSLVESLEPQPRVVVVGDAETRLEARRYTLVARGLSKSMPETEFVIVPKCKSAFGEVDQQFVLGYPMGYSDVKYGDYSELSDWRGRRVHLLGGSPPRQWKAIQRLTQPVLTREPPASVVGLDWNGPPRVAYLGESWSREGWRRADTLTIRATVRRSLREIRQFWCERGVWPERTPVERYGSAVVKPDDLVFAADGDRIRDPERLESATVVEYGGTRLAFRSEKERRFVEHTSPELTLDHSSAST